MPLELVICKQPDSDGHSQCSVTDRVKRGLTDMLSYPDRSTVCNLENTGWA